MENPAYSSTQTYKGLNGEAKFPWNSNYKMSYGGQINLSYFAKFKGYMNLFLYFTNDQNK